MESGSGKRVHVDHDGFGAVAKSLRRESGLFKELTEPMGDRLARARSDAMSAWSSVRDHPQAATVFDRQGTAMIDAKAFLAAAVADLDSMGRTAQALLNEFGDQDGLNAADLRDIRRVANLPAPTEVAEESTKGPQA